MFEYWHELDLPFWFWESDNNFGTRIHLYGFSTHVIEQLHVCDNSVRLARVNRNLCLQKEWDTVLQTIPCVLLGSEFSGPCIPIHIYTRWSSAFIWKFRTYSSSWQKYFRNCVLYLSKICRSQLESNQKSKSQKLLKKISLPVGWMSKQYHRRAIWWLCGCTNMQTKPHDW